MPQIYAYLRVQAEKVAYYSDKLADLLDVSPNTLYAWLKVRRP